MPRTMTPGLLLDGFLLDGIDHHVSCERHPGSKASRMNIVDALRHQR